MDRRKYNVYDGDAIIFSGSQVDIKKRFNLKGHMPISTYAKKNIKILKKYRVEWNGYIDDIPHISKKEKEHNEDMKFLLFHLKFYGNTELQRDPSKYVDELKSYGYNVRIIEHPKCGKERKWWYVERI